MTQTYFTPYFTFSNFGKQLNENEFLLNVKNNAFSLLVFGGVCQLLNKIEEASGKVKAFNRNDEQFLEAFAIFCGLGIQNTQMYETVERAMAKQEVTLEVSAGRHWLLEFPTEKGTMGTEETRLPWATCAWDKCPYRSRGAP